MLTLHIANKNYSSWSLRPWVLMRTLEIPFQERLHVFGSDFGFSPTKRVPVLTDDEAVVWDSLAIAEYLADSHPQVWPADRIARAWARSAAAEMHSGFTQLRNDCSMTCGQRIQLIGISPQLRVDLDRLEAVWNEGLARFGGPFLAGPVFTAVDAFFAPVALRIQTYGLHLNDTALAYARRLRELPAMQAWYAEALLEPWREGSHEAHIAACGRIIDDLRQHA